MVIFGFSVFTSFVNTSFNPAIFVMSLQLPDNSVLRSRISFMRFLARVKIFDAASADPALSKAPANLIPVHSKSKLLKTS
jgi:hypothetical protein